MKGGRRQESVPGPVTSQLMSNDVEDNSSRYFGKHV
jgi:hypothetical protein